MEIKTKFSIDDIVWFMHDNAVYFGRVKEMHIRTFRGCDSYVTEQTLYTVAGHGRDYSSMFETSLFKSKQELLESL